MMTPAKKWDVALVMPRWLNYSAELADGIADYAEEHPHFRLCELPMEEYGDHSRLDKASVDAVIVWADAQDTWVEKLWARGIPIVNCGSDLADTAVPMVATASITQQVIDFLVDLARPTIGYVCPDPEKSPGWQQMKDEFFAIARDAGFAPQFCPYVDTDPSDEPGVLSTPPKLPKLNEFLNTIRKPAAIWCAYDSIAVQLCRAAEHNGLKVPEDIAVLGAGNSRVGRFAGKPISTFAYPSQRVGYLAMALVHRMLRGDSIPTEDYKSFVPVPPVIPRESTGHGEMVDESIHHAYRLIAKHACEGITVNEIVDTVGLSRQAFHKRFVDAFNCTPAEKIRGLRLEKAEELLATTDLAVTRISDYCGFSEQSKFYNFFKREAGCSPSDWRAKHRGE